MRNAESLAAVKKKERERESILLPNTKSVISITFNFVNKTIIEHRIQAMCFRRT